MDAPAPTEVPGGDLPADLLKLICHLLPCPVDRRHMGQVCRFWRRSVTPEHPPPPPLPSIVLTRAGGPSFSCVFRGCITHRFKFPNDARVARYLSSYDGGGFSHYRRLRSRLQTLINVLTGQRFMLPFLLRLQYSLYCGWHLPMVILAATLSSPPVQGHSVIAAIVSSFDDTELIGERKVAFWRLGDMNQWITDGNMDHFHVEMIYFQLEDHEYDEHVTARYLVESRGELLMVVRLGQPTSSFRVFQMVQVRMPNGPITGYTWQELHALDGRALFVGRCCSRSYEVAEQRAVVEQFGG
ncbi:hypothetical protein GUJ93_ZPchr0650g16441 [Zizania palustris]|uniref:KIB1-4 beta-propeller domain-containing protein n=1 Tax=Zizania palustris TaxID=103762 RepID=A0A8J5QST4_ZIZPA|nr:hypothetical protein GUJ93_ZPchr0650g16441 [Zizania palustris]